MERKIKKIKFTIPEISYDEVRKNHVKFLKKEAREHKNKSRKKSK